MFRCPKLEEMVRCRAGIELIDDVAADLKKEYQCPCEFVPPAPPKPGRCTCEGCECPCAPPKQFNQPQIQEPPPVMVCYKVPKQKALKLKQLTKATENNRTIKSMSNPGGGEEVVHRLTQSKSRELRGGIMYIGCHCEKRDGLQDDCQRTECHGSPECLTRPYPICGPSEFAGGKHLEKIWGPRALQKDQYDAALEAQGGRTNIPMGIDNGAEGSEPDYEYHCFPASIKVAEVDTCCCQCR